MGGDFGAVRRRRGDRKVIGLIVVGSLVAIGAVVGAVAFNAWHDERAAARAADNAWTHPGPPCPSITADEWRQLQVTPQRSSFEGIAAERAHGDVDCQQQDTGPDGRATSPYAVCSFSAPLAIHLTTKTGDLYFKPGVAQPARITMLGGQPRCIMGGAGG